MVLVPMTWIDLARSETWYALGLDPPLRDADRLLWEQTAFPLAKEATVRRQLREFLTLRATLVTDRTVTQETP